MKFNFFLNPILLLCLGLSAQIFTMQIPVPLVSGACIKCNKFNQQVNDLPCTHPICTTCDEQIKDDNTNLGFPGVCSSCNYVYLTGDVVSNAQGYAINKLLFDPALRESFSCKNVALSLFAGMVTGYMVGSGIWGTTNAVLFCGTAAGPSMSYFWNYVLKSKEINNSLKKAAALKLKAPHLSQIVEKRIKAFQRKHLIYSCVASAIPFAVCYILSDKMAGQALKSDVAGYSLSSSAIVASYAIPMIALDMWGTRYESIPKLK